MKTFKYFLALALLAGMYSCFKDEGNYKYHEINDVKIADFEKMYECIAFEEVLNITPEIDTKTPEGRLSYIWAISSYYKEDGSGWKDRIPEADTVSYDRNLSFPVDLGSGVYYIYYTVTNEDTGVSYYKDAQLQVNTLFTKGYYILKEVDGDSDVDLFYERKSRSADFADAFATLHGSPISGKPTTFMQYGAYMFKTDPMASDYDHTRTLNIVTENDLWVVDTRSLAPIYTYETLFYGPVAPQKPHFMRDNLVGITYASNLGYYSAYQNYDFGFGTNGQFGFPEEAPNVKLNYTVSPHMTFVSGGQPAWMASGETVFFDDLNGNFMFAGFNNDLNVFSDTREEPDPEGQYPPLVPNGIEHKLLFMGGNNSGGDMRIIAIFEDKDNSSTRYLYRLNTTELSTKNPVSSIITLDPSMVINTVTEFVMKERDAPVIYYLHNNKVYMYDVNNNVEKVLSPLGLPTDETITYVGHRFYDYMMAPAADIYDNLAIATYKDGKYKMHLYEHRGGEPDGNPVVVLQGEGKAFSMVFVSPDFNNMVTSCLPGARR